MPDKLARSDYRLIAACLLACAVSLFIGVRYFYRAFPEASIDFKVNRESSLPIAMRFLAGHDVLTAGYRHAASFRYDGDAKVFLERELGLERANALMGSPIKVWRWGHRWFRPLQKEEIRVEITPGGELAGFDHTLPEDAPGADLSLEAARSLAESFLVLEVNRTIDDLEYLDSETQKRPYRTDHLFNWKVAGLDLRGATYRVTVTVQGDRVDGYSEYLRVPEEWSRGYARLRSLNEGASQVDLLFFALLGLGMLVTLGDRVRLRDVRWKTALSFALIACALQFLSSLNEFPVAQYDFDTTGTYASFAGRTVVFGALGALSFGGIILILTACCEPLYRASFPSHLSISRMLTWESFRTRRFLHASLVGVTLAFVFFAYEIGFYLLANRFGAWAPADIPYTDLLNTRFPWVSVLLGGFFPAVSEEWVFRAFSLPFLGRLLRHRWLAIGVASFVWGFGHSNYPNQPFFIRGIEVGIVGLVLSWAMIRFGILAPLIAHYSIDAFYSAFLFLRSGNAYLMTTGAVTAGINLIPLAIAVVAYLATGRFRAGTSVTNDAERAPTPVFDRPPAMDTAAPSWEPLPRSRAYIAFGLLALGTLLLAFRPPLFGDFVQFKIPGEGAARAARDFLARLKFSPGGFLEATQPITRLDYTAAQYVYRAGGIEALNRIYGTQTRPIAWQTRFFQPLQKEEFRVNVDPADGHVISFRHDLPENAPGADLHEMEARPVATSFLAAQGYDLSRFTLKETRSEKPKQRRDTTFTWEARAGTEGAIGEARLRVEAGVFGDSIGLWTHYIKTPEEWNRAREREGMYSLCAAAIRMVFIATMFAFAFLTLLRATRHGGVRWRLAGSVAAAAMFLEALNALNSIPEFFFDYDTEVGMQVAVTSGLIQGVLVVIGIGLAAGLATALVLACYPDAPAVLRRENRAAWGRDAVTASIASLGLIMILQWVAARLQFHGSRLALVPSISPPDGVGTYLPIISSLRDAALATLFFSAVLAFGVHLWSRLRTAAWIKLALIVGLLASFLPDNARRLSEAALDLIPSVLLVAFACTVVILFLRTNYLGYILSAAVVAVARTSSSILGQGNLALTTQGWILWGGLLALLVVTVLRAPARVPGGAGISG